MARADGEQGQGRQGDPPPVALQRAGHAERGDAAGPETGLPLRVEGRIGEREVHLPRFRGHLAVRGRETEQECKQDAPAARRGAAGGRWGMDLRGIDDSWPRLGAGGGLPRETARPQSVRTSLPCRSQAREVER
jgi:hypothetical protein